MKKLATILATTIIALPGIAISQDAQSILDKVIEENDARKAGVAGYVVDQSLFGFQNLQYYARTSITAADGGTYETFRLVPPPEVQKQGQQTLSAAELELFAQAAEMSGDAMSTEIENGMREAGLPPGTLASLGSPAEPWASPDPRTMMGAGAGFLRGAAAAQSQVGDGKAEATDDFDDIAEFAVKAKLIGEEDVDGSKAFHLRAADLNMAQQSDGQEFTIQAIGLWIDMKMYVPLKMRMEGIAKMDGETRPVFIEKLSTDYRQVPNSNMYESYRQVMRMGGVLSKKEEKEMAEARIQLADLDKQMAAMPESQRKMMESMMGSQIEMMRGLIDNGAFEVVTTINEIRAY